MVNRITYYFIRSFFGLIAATLLLSAQQTGCSRRNGDGPTDPAKSTGKPREVSFLSNQLQRRTLKDVYALSARARIFSEAEGSSVAANANLIWLRDSVLWVNVKKFGIEAVRALVTRDSVYVLNRLDRTYSVRSLESLQRQYNLPGGFPLMEQVVLATASFFPDMELRSGIKDNLHQLIGSNGRYAADYRIEEGSFLLRQESFIQQRDARSVTLGFGNYKKTPGIGQFPYLRHIEAYSPENGALRLEIEFSDVEINVPKAYRFEIPEHYSRVD